MKKTIVLVTLFHLSFLVPVGALTLTTLTTKATFENAGVRVAYSGDSDENGTVAVEYRQKGAADWIPGHPMIRITGGRFVTSLFFLQENTTYEVRLTPEDPEGVTVDFSQPFD